jgi:hypothetical protein
MVVMKLSLKIERRLGGAVKAQVRLRRQGRRKRGIMILLLSGFEDGCIGVKPLCEVRYELKRLRSGREQLDL